MYRMLCMSIDAETNIVPHVMVCVSWWLYKHSYYTHIIGHVADINMEFFNEYKNHWYFYV